MSTQVYLSTWPRKKRLRLVPFSRMISARSTTGVVDQQRPTLAAGDIFGLVEALRGQAAEGAQVIPLVSSEQAMGVVFDHAIP